MPAPRTGAVSAHNEESRGEAQPGGTAYHPGIVSAFSERALVAWHCCRPSLTFALFLFGRVARLEGRANKREIVRDGRKL